MPCAHNKAPHQHQKLEPLTVSQWFPVGVAWSVQAPQRGGFRAASCPAGTPAQPRGARGWTAATQSGSVAGGLLQALRGRHPLSLREASGPPSPCTGCWYDLQHSLCNPRERSHCSPRGTRAQPRPKLGAPAPPLGRTLHSEILTNAQLDLLALPGAASVTLGQSLPSLSVTGPCLPTSKAAGRIRQEQRRESAQDHTHKVTAAFSPERELGVWVQAPLAPESGLGKVGARRAYLPRPGPARPVRAGEEESPAAQPASRARGPSQGVVPGLGVSPADTGTPGPDPGWGAGNK